MNRNVADLPTRLSWSFMSWVLKGGGGKGGGDGEINLLFLLWSPFNPYSPRWTPGEREKEGQPLWRSGMHFCDFYLPCLSPWPPIRPLPPSGHHQSLPPGYAAGSAPKCSQSQGTVPGTKHHPVDHFLLAFDACHTISQFETLLEHLHLDLLGWPLRVIWQSKRHDWSLA